MCIFQIYTISYISCNFWDYINDLTLLDKEITYIFEIEYQYIKNNLKLQKRNIFLIANVQNENGI